MSRAHLRLPGGSSTRRNRLTTPWPDVRSPDRNRPTDGTGWYRITNLDRGIGGTEIFLYDEIGLWGVTAADLVRELQNLDVIHIDLRINSPGGDAWDGIAIYNALCNHPASVTTHIDGLAASAASFIAQAGSRVVIARNGTMMIHDAEGICIGNAADMTEMAELLDRTSDNIADIYAQRCSTVLQWRKRMKAVSWYVGQEAVDAGLADETYEPEQGTDDDPAERRRRSNARASATTTTTTTTGGYGRVPTPVNTACPSHESATTDEDSWDAGANERRLPTPVPVATVRRVYGWYDSARTEDGGLPKDACKLPHHIVSEDGTPGAAHLGGVRNALGRLPQSDIPSDEQETVRNHLQSHLDDADSGEEDAAPLDIAAWWSPDVFRTAVAVAADQQRCYGFDPDAFRESMRVAAEDCPAPDRRAAPTIEPDEPVISIDRDDFSRALREGLL